MKRLIVLGSALVSLCGSAATYYWKGGASEYGDYTALSNWSTESAEGSAATMLPGSGDSLSPTQNYAFDLAGQKHQLDSWNPNGDWNSWDLSLRNGELEFLNSVSTHSGKITVDAGGILTMPSAMSFTPAVGDAGIRKLVVKNGGTWNFAGKFYGYHWQFDIEEGGTATIDTTNWGGHTGSFQSDNYLKNNGTLNLPQGLVWVRGGGDNHYTTSFEQLAGTLNLGGKISNKNVASKALLTISLEGGTINVTGDAAFEVDTIHLSNQVNFEVAEGKKIEMGTIAYSDGSVVTKSGAGTMVFDGNMPPNVYLWGGTIRIAAPNQTFAGSVRSASPVTVEIAEKGFTFAAEVCSDVNYTIDSAVFSVGDTILTSANADVLAAAKASLATTGVNTTIDGTALKMSASEVKFNSTTVTNINDPNGWSTGAVPAAGMPAQVVGEGVTVVVSDTDSAIPAFSGLTVGAGATLKLDCADTVVPCPLTLVSGAKLVLVQAAELKGISGVLGKDGALNEITVPAGVTLKVPGNTKFANVNLDLKGSLVATSDGKLVFGYAKNGVTAKFAMTADGATITAQNASGSENGSRLEFVCPEKGGTVVVDDPIVLNKTTLTYNKLDGMAFGLNNPTDKPFTVKAVGTDLNIGAETVVAGAANLVLEGSRLLRKRHSEGDTNESMYNIVVQQQGKITVGEGASIYAGVTRVNGNTTDGVIQLNPDEKDFVGIEFLDGGTAHWYKADGLNKGAISFADATFEFTKAYWWGWGNRSHLFNRMTAVKLQEGKTLTFKCVKEGLYSSNNDTYTYFIMEAPFTGAGNLSFTSERSSQTMQPTIVCDNNTCTGTLSVDPAKNVLVHFANGANWAGKVVLNGKVDFVPVDQDHTGFDAKPSTVTFGAVQLDKDFTVRLWGKEGLKNDTINITGEGWSGEATLLFAMQDGYEPKPTDKWLLGTAPKGVTLPTTSEKWTLVAEGEDETVNVYITPAALSYNFISNGDKSTNLGDASAWEGGKVPTGKEVTILGEGVTAEINAEQTLPQFASIDVKGGATLVINADTDTLPPLTIDGSSKLIVKAGATLTLPTSFLCANKENESGEFVSMAKLVVEKDATLVIPTNTKFRNVDMEIYGLVKSSGEHGEIIFGYANSGETAYFAFKAEDARFEFPGDQNNGIRTLSFVRPAATGRVKVIGDITIKNSPFVNWGWADWMSKYIGQHNPTDETFKMIWDATDLEACYDLTIGGGAQLEFINGAKLTRQHRFAGMWVDVSIGEAASVTFDGEGTGVMIESTNNSSFLLNTSEDNRTVVTLKNGASINTRRVFADHGAKIAIANGTSDLVVGKPNTKYVEDETTGELKLDSGEEYMLYSGATIDIAEGAKARFVSKDALNGNTVGMKDVVFLGQFSGAGDVEIANLTDKKFNVLLMNGSDGFTGSVKVVPPVEETETNATTMTFAANDSVGLDWTGATLVLDSHVKMAEDGVTLTFGEINVAEDYELRFAEDAPAGMLDVLNVTGKGFTGDGKLIIAVSETFNPGKTVYPLGTIAKGAALPKLKGGYWKIVTETDAEGVTTYGLKRNNGFAVYFR